MTSHFTRLKHLALAAVAKVMGDREYLTRKAAQDAARKHRAEKNTGVTPDDRPKPYRKGDNKSGPGPQRDKDWLRRPQWRGASRLSAREARVTMREADLKREWRQLRNLGQNSVPCHVYIERGMEA